MKAGTQLLQDLRTDLKSRRLAIEREVQICERIEGLIRLFEEAEGHPPETHQNNGPAASSPTVDGFGGRKFPRQAEFEAMSTVVAVRNILAGKDDGLHADKIAAKIFAVDPTDKKRFLKVKSVVVSEIVKGVKRGEFRRAGQNIFALASKPGGDDVLKP
jgi:hypothetical protein